MRLSSCSTLPNALLLGALLLWSLSCGSPVAAQVAAPAPSDPAPAKSPQQDWSEAVSASTEQFQLFLNADAQEPLEMKRVFQWADPVLPEGKSLCLLYFHEGRPMASLPAFRRPTMPPDGGFK
jgi:hypothetical protein